MDLSFLIPSKVRREVLRFFAENPSVEMGVREIARELKLSPQVTHRELVNLENWGFLFSSKKGNTRAFRVNERFQLYPALRQIYERDQADKNKSYEIDQVQDLDKMIAKVSKISVPNSLLRKMGTSKRLKPRAWAEGKILSKNIL